MIEIPEDEALSLKAKAAAQRLSLEDWFKKLIRPAMIELQEVSFSHGSLSIFDNLSLKIYAGEMCAVLGPNGAGKSTFIKLLAGILRPARGSIATTIGPDKKRERILGVLPDDLGLFETLTVEEHLTLAALAAKVTSSEVRSRTQALLELLNLSAARNRPLRQCSDGMRKKVALSMALIGDCRCLLLDEPFETLDLESSQALMMLLPRFCAAGKTVVFTSHSLSTTEALASRLLILRDGRICLDHSQPLLRPMADYYWRYAERPSLRNIDWLL